MNDRQRRVLGLLHRVQEFCAAYPPPAPAPAYEAKIEALNALVRGLEGHVAGQRSADGQARNGTRVRRALIKALREEYMVPLNRIAGTLIGAIAEVDQMFRMPNTSTDQAALLGAARSMLKHARPLADVFVMHGLHIDFIARMEALIAAIDQAGESRFAGLRQRAGATRGMEVGLGEGRRIITYLDVIIRHAFAGNTQVLHEWQRAHRLDPRTQNGTPSGSVPEGTAGGEGAAGGGSTPGAGSAPDTGASGPATA